MIQPSNAPVSTEIAAFLSIVTVAVKDFKAGKSASDVLKDIEKPFLDALTGLPDFKSDVANHAAVENTVALAVADLTNAFVG